MTDSFHPLPADVPSLLLRVTLVLALASILANALPRASAASRHAVQWMGLAAALGVPVLFLTAPAVGWIPGPASAAPAVPVEERVDAGLAPPPAAGNRGAEPPALGSGVDPEPAPASAAADAVAGEGPRLPSPLLLVWGLGSCLALLPLLLAPARLRALRRRSRPASEAALVAALRDAAGRLGLARLPGLRVGAEAAMPLCFGFFEPTVLLPGDAPGWRSDRLRAVLLHELAHVRRRDLWTHALAGATRAIFWFHPLAWLAHRQLASWRERACDDLVLSTGEPAVGYGEQLLHLARAAAAAAGRGPGLAMARPSSLETRMRALLDPRRRRTRPGRWALAGGLVSAATLGAGVALSGCRTASASAEGPRPASDYASMSAPELIEAVTAADDRRRAEVAGWADLHLEISEVDEDRTDAGAWEAWGPRSDMSLWLADTRSGRFRVDFLPVTRVWINGARPFSETRLSKRWDGQRFQKLDWIYGSGSGTYGGRVTEEREMAAGSEDWRNQIREWSEALGVLLDDRNAASGLRFHASNQGIGGAYLNAGLAEGEVWVSGQGLFGDAAPAVLFFDPAHGLRLTRVLRIPDDGGEPTVLHEVTRWREVPGTGVTLPARWVSPMPQPRRPAGRRVTTLDGFAFFEAAEDPGAVYRVTDADLASGQTPPFRQPDVILGEAATLVTEAGRTQEQRPLPRQPGVTPGGAAGRDPVPPADGSAPVVAIDLSLHAASFEPQEGFKLTRVPGLERDLYVAEAPILDASSVVSAGRGVDQHGVPTLVATFTEDASERLKAFTWDHIGLPLAIVFEGEVVSAPTVMGAFGDAFAVNFANTEEAEATLARLLSDATPAGRADAPASERQPTP